MNAIIIIIIIIIIIHSLWPCLPRAEDPTLDLISAGHPWLRFSQQVHRVCEDDDMDDLSITLGGQQQ